VIVAPLPSDETERLEALARLGILDTGPEPAFDDLARLASIICETPMALVSLVDSQRQWFKARVGVGMTETPRDLAFCAHAIHHDGLFIVPDSTEDDRFRGNPLVTSEPGIRFYAGSCLTSPEGRRLGTLCVLDRRPRTLTDHQAEALATLGRAVSAQLLLRRREQQLVERGNALSETNAQLERSARMKDEFLASMSHELRTPLNAILGMSEALRVGVFGLLDARQGEAVTTIEDSGRNLLQLINDVLDISKIEAGRLEIAPGEIEAEPFAASCLRLFREAAHHKGVRLSSRVHPGLHVLRADPLRMKQIVANLLSNAVKFTPRGGEVLLELAAEPESGGFRVVVSDTGVGIAQEDHERLFEPFVQADAGLSREYGGTGLGLALVRRLAELHGGGVDVRSEPRRGARFTVRIPGLPASAFGSSRTPRDSGMEARGPDTGPAAAATPPNASAETAPGKRPGRVGRDRLLLLAEDSAVNVRTVGGFLESLGYRVAVARNGREAVERIASDRPLLVLMDVQMPVMDGLEAIRRLRANPDSAGLPVIALTALAMPGDRERCLEAGADAFLSKPVSLSGLAELVEGLLSGDPREVR
jgi:signal transduction histidine kinase